MITAQDIREKTFEKARLNGYDMAAVDDFLEELADDVTNSQKENAVLKSKMKVLVDKIEEYRSNEEALNMALLSAQKLAVQIENDARTRANAVLAEAEEKANARVGNITNEVKEQEQRLSAARLETANFLAQVEDLFGKELESIKNIINGLVPDVEPSEEKETVSVDEAVRSIESSVSASAPERSMRLDFGTAKKSANLDNTQPFTL